MKINKIYLLIIGISLLIIPSIVSADIGPKSSKTFNIIFEDINDLEIVGKAGIGITTDPQILPAAFATTRKLHLGGEEVVDHLLTILKL